MASSLTDVTVVFPTWEEIFRVLSFQAGYNTAVVVFGSLLLGIAAGTIGCFAVLRRRALIGDALAHSALPGIAAAFLFATAFGFEAKSIFILLTGAAISGLIGVLCVQFLSSETRLQEDAAIGIVLSVFFGIGITLLSIIQSLPSTQAAGLSRFIYGQTAAMQFNDAVLLAVMAGVVVCVTTLMNKEFRLLCFDPEFAQSLGWSTRFLDIVLLAILTTVTIIGLQSVGILLVVALLIIPATAARFWTERLKSMILISAFFGGCSGYFGASASALLPRLPAGAVIVLSAGVLFVISMCFAPRRGVLAGGLRRLMLRYKVSSDHLLRHLYELCETNQLDYLTSVPVSTVQATLPPNPILKRLFLSMIKNKGDVTTKGSTITLTQSGEFRARELVRNHRLWEEYVFSTSQVDLAHVDYSADFVEHALSAELVQALELKLNKAGRLPTENPESIHPLDKPLMPQTPVSQTPVSQPTTEEDSDE